MSDNNPTRIEIYDAIDRLERNLQTYMQNGFDGLNRRMDIANGRTTKNEDSLNAHSIQIGILMDRSNNAVTKAKEAARDEIAPAAARVKWIASAVAGGVLTVFELLQRFGVF